MAFSKMKRSEGMAGNVITEGSIDVGRNASLMMRKGQQELQSNPKEAGTGIWTRAWKAPAMPNYRICRTLSKPL